MFYIVLLGRERGVSGLWVGRDGKELFVYDPEIQLPNCPHLFLWTRRDGMRKYIAKLAREDIKPCHDASESASILEEYKKWRDRSGASFLEAEKPYYAERAQREHKAKTEIEERHRRRLKMLRYEYLGVRPSTIETARRRVTHCYNCHEPLDNSVDIECVACGWILCACGACGCGYGGRANRESEIGDDAP